MIKPVTLAVKKIVAQTTPADADKEWEVFFVAHRTPAYAEADIQKRFRTFSVHRFPSILSCTLLSGGAESP